jgi:hypothetical protein
MAFCFLKWETNINFLKLHAHAVQAHAMHTFPAHTHAMHVTFMSELTVTCQLLL